MVEQVVEQHRYSVAVRERDPPVGVLGVRTGVILRAGLPHRIGQRDGGQQRRAVQRQPVHASHKVLFFPVLNHPVARAQELHHAVAFVVALGLLILHRTAEEAQLRTGFDVAAREVRRRRREVVHRDGDERVGAVLLWRRRRSVVLLLKQGHHGAQQSALVEVVGHPRLEGPEVLANDDRPGTLRLKGQDANERLVIDVDVRAV